MCKSVSERDCIVLIAFDFLLFLVVRTTKIIARKNEEPNCVYVFISSYMKNRRRLELSDLQTILSIINSKSSNS